MQQTPRSFGLLLMVPIAMGCVPIPHPHKKLPELQFRVSDDVGVPVARARVHVFGGLVDSYLAEWSSTLQTDSLGRAHLLRAREWHPVFVLLPHQELAAGWAWCVEAPGHEAVAGRLDREPDAEMRVFLPRSPAPRHCPAKPEYLDDVAPDNSEPMPANPVR